MELVNALDEFDVQGQRSRSSAKKIDFCYVKINFLPFSNAIFKPGRNDVIRRHMMTVLLLRLGLV